MRSTRRTRNHKVSRKLRRKTKSRRLKMGGWKLPLPEGHYQKQKEDTLINEAMNKLDKEADEYVFQKYPNVSPVLRNLLINNAKGFELNAEQVKMLRENGDIMQIMKQRHPERAPYGHGRIQYNNETVFISRPQYDMIVMALAKEPPVRNPSLISNDLQKYRESKYGSSPAFWASKGEHEFDILVKQDDLTWKLYLKQLKDDYITEKRKEIIETIKKKVADEMNAEKHGLNDLKIEPTSDEKPPIAQQQKQRPLHQILQHVEVRRM